MGHDITNPSVGWGGPSDAAVLYGPEDVVADLDGLEQVKAERVRRPVPTDDGEKIAIDVLVRGNASAAAPVMTDASHDAEAAGLAIRLVGDDSRSPLRRRRAAPVSQS